MYPTNVYLTFYLPNRNSLYNYRVSSNRNDQKSRLVEGPSFHHESALKQFYCKLFYGIQLGLANPTPRYTLSIQMRRIGVILGYSMLIWETDKLIALQLTLVYMQNLTAVELISVLGIAGKPLYTVAFVIIVYEQSGSERRVTKKWQLNNHD